MTFHTTKISHPGHWSDRIWLLWPGLIAVQQLCVAEFMPGQLCPSWTHWQQADRRGGGEGGLA